jgi:hypothetical protein
MHAGGGAARACTLGRRGVQGTGSMARLCGKVGLTGGMIDLAVTRSFMGHEFGLGETWRVGREQFIAMEVRCRALGV